MENDELNSKYAYIYFMEGAHLPTKRSGLVSDDIEADGRPPVFLILSGLCSSNNCSATFVRN